MSFKEKFSLIISFRQYAIRLVHKEKGDVKFLMKLRGITLDTNNAHRIQFDRFKEMIEKFDEQQTVVMDYDRLGPSSMSQVFTKKIRKKYRAVQNKGLISKNDGFRIYPFGYK